MTTKFTIELPFTWDFFLRKSLQRAMQTYWEESLRMAKSPYISHKTDDIYWKDAIDQTADMILQVLQQENNN